MRHRVCELVVLLHHDRPPRAEGLPGDALLALELEADELRRQAVHGRAPERAARRVEEVAVGGVDGEELGDLVDEELEHRVELELAAERLRGPEQAGLLLELPRVLLEET